ncbi:hypothetical protein QV01_09425 [Gallibacterium genomosp. 3]|uniref:Uncharacterized protein n=1 Tax=Gallibacterium genomosp. 3 TaxID=505345 RepID=A0A1A7NMQ0_9PAST|nr:hypothetical protein [Gallibacterium genomosp. 3]OBW90885.1 hypothetical protein QV01_09425 [Gallibacterium genomosp. 3]
MCRWLIKKVSKKYKDIYNVFASRSKSEKHCCVANHICCVVFIILLLLINYDRIIAEITTPIRCSMASEIKVLMSVEEWQKQRGIEKLRPIKDSLEREPLVKLSYDLTSLEKKQIPQFINVNNMVYTLQSVIPHTKIATYFHEKNYLNIFITYYLLIYDLELNKPILSTEQVYGQYWTLMGPGSNWVKCDKSNSSELTVKSYQYNF